MRLARLALKVQDFSDLSDFYCGLLGMRSFGPETAPRYGYNQDSCLLEFHGGARQPYRPGEQDFYWKFGITLRDLDHAVSFLKHQNYSVTEPKQFRDIGYMSHLRDPKGFSIELLQQGFEDRAQPAGTGHPIGGQATLAHTTLRVKDIEAARHFCEERLGMRLLSIQPVKDLGFCLYFYAWRDDDLPNPDLEAVENREWLWARPYTLLELQHIRSDLTSDFHLQSDASGFVGLAYERSGTLTYLTPEQFLP